LKRLACGAGTLDPEYVEQTLIALCGVIPLSGNGLRTDWGTIIFFWI
jgi:hypothetical protein